MSHARNVARAVLAALAYFASARLGYAFAIPHGIVTLWPPSGVMLGLLILSDRRDWAALIAGAFTGGVASDLLSGQSPAFALAAAVANCGESLLAAWLVTRRLGPVVRLSSLRAVVVFVGWAAIASNAVTACLGALVINRGFTGSLARAWTAWWVGDGLGMLIVAPVLLGWVGAPRRLMAFRRGHAIEFAVLLTLLIAAGVIALGPTHDWPIQPGPYVVFPLLFWAALRFGPTGAATASLMLAAIATWYAALGEGPFALATSTGIQVAVQTYVYLTLAALSSLMPAAIRAERRTAERRLASSEERYRQLFESNPQPMWVYDLDTLRFLAVSEAAIDTYGYSHDEFLSMTIRDIRPPQDVPAVLDSLAHVRGGERVEGRVWRHRRKDGSDLDVEIFSRAIEFGGRPARLALANDVSERRRTDAALLQSELRFRQMAEHIEEAFFVVDLTTREPLYVSPTWATIWGRPIEQGRDPKVWLESIHPDDRAAMQDGIEAVARGEPETTTFRVLRPDGTIRWVLGRTVPVRDDTGRVYRMVGVSRDVTELRKVQDQFVQSQKMEAVGRLAGGVAHDFNNMLTVILSWSDVLIERHAEDPEELEYLREIKAAGDRAAGLTRQLLAFSRKQVLAPRVLELNVLVTEQEKMLRRLIGEDVELCTVLAPSLGAVLADPGQVEQVIMNLAVNARDAMPDGGTLTIETANAAPSEGRYVMLSVRDSGVGMDADTSARAFEPFFTTKGAGQGTGLGLSTVLGIVEQSGGTIALDTAPGAGTTFRVYWPRVDPSAAIVEAPSGPRARSRSTETILVAEDEEQIRKLTARILQVGGYTVLLAEDAGHALEIARDHPGPIHLLLSDVIMPRMAGPELAARLMKTRPDVRVLYVSGYTEDAISRRGVLDEGVAFLQKPFTPETLLAKVREVLDA